MWLPISSTVDEKAWYFVMPTFAMILQVNSLRQSDAVCVGKLAIIAADNSLAPDRRQTTIWNNAGIFCILLVGPLGTNFSEILIKIHAISIKKMHSKMSFGKWRPFCLSFNVLIGDKHYHTTRFSIYYSDCSGNHFLHIGYFKYELRTPTKSSHSSRGNYRLTNDEIVIN